MHIDLTDQQRELQRELQSYFSSLMTPERVEALKGLGGEWGDSTVYKDTVRQMGKDGWLGIGWPTEYGGQNRSAMEQLIFSDEAAKAGAPVPHLTLNTVGPTLMRFGNDELKEKFLPKIVSGEVHFSIGYSEPASGTDLASLRTKAVRDGDDWVINGQKMWTSLIQYADYVWLAARTDPDEPRHKGLSIIVVPTAAEGFSFTPVETVAGVGTSATYYQDIRVPVTNTVGEVNGGWGLITNQLNEERVTLSPSAPMVRDLGQVVEWAKNTTRPDGRRVMDDEWVQVLLGRAHARIDMLTVLNYQIASSGDALNPADASATKVYGSELATEIYRTLIEVVGPDALVRDGAGQQLHGRLERMYRSSLVMTFGGGTNEIQRDIIGILGLGLPAAARFA